MVSSCSHQHWSTSSSYCPLYTLPVVSTRDGRTYRNPHCAACNGQNINETQCSPGRTLTVSENDEQNVTARNDSVRNTV